MNRVLLIVGIVIIIAGVISLAFAALNMLGYHRALDGSNEFYARLQNCVRRRKRTRTGPPVTRSAMNSQLPALK